MRTQALFLELDPDYAPNNDPWGCAMGVFFAVADELAARGVQCPEVWRFRPSPFGQSCEGYAYETLQELEPDDDELLRLGAFLHRLTGRIDRAGLSY